MRPSWRTLLALWGPLSRTAPEGCRPGIGPVSYRMERCAIMACDRATPANVKRPWLNG